MIHQTDSAFAQKVSPVLSRRSPQRGAIALGGLAVVLAVLSSCQTFTKGTVNAQPTTPEAGAPEDLPAVETAIAQPTAESGLEYTGTVEPAQSAVVRAQAEGQLLNLSVDVGDRVTAGTVIGQIDDRILFAESRNEQATLSALVAEVAEVEAEIRNAEVLVAQRQVELRQAEADAERLRSLWVDGAIPEQQYETAETARQTAAQAVLSAEEAVRIQEQSLQAARERVAAQQATLAQVEERRADTALSVPIDSVVLERSVEPGTLVRPGEEILVLGSFDTAQVTLEVSELDLANVRIGQTVQVRLDAFPDAALSGRVSRISPVADPVARLVPVEVTIAANSVPLSQGLLARVTFAETTAQRIWVPESALEVAESGESPTVFVVQTGDPAVAEPKAVTLGDSADGKVEVLSGLQPGETYVVSSSRSLSSSSPVRLSVLSEQQ